MAHDETDKDAGWDTLRMELMDTLAVSELPDTSMTCATLRALLDILSINMTRGEAKALIVSSLNARLGSSDGVSHSGVSQIFKRG